MADRRAGRVARALLRADRVRRRRQAACPDQSEVIRWALGRLELRTQAQHFECPSMLSPDSEDRGIGTHGETAEGLAELDTLVVARSRTPRRVRGTYPSRGIAVKSPARHRRDRRRWCTLPARHVSARHARSVCRRRSRRSCAARLAVLGTWRSGNVARCGPCRRPGLQVFSSSGNRAKGRSDRYLCGPDRGERWVAVAERPTPDGRLCSRDRPP